MSLINDALKRAKETQRQSPPTGAPPLPPVELPARGGNGWLLALAAVLFLAAAGLFIGMALFKAKAPPVEAAKAPAISTPPPEPVSAPVSKTLPAAPAPKITPLPPVSKTPPVAPATNPPQAVVMEELPKVQGVIFNAAHPVAIVDGKAVSPGDHVGDFQVKEILKSSVVFQRADGSQKTLKIGE